MYCDHHSSYKELREKAGMSILYVGRLRTAICEVFKVVNDIGPVNFKKHFTLKGRLGSFAACGA